MGPTPYYDRDGIQIYCGDCREIIPQLSPVDLVLTDPPFGARRPSARRLADERFDEISGNESVDATWANAAFQVVAEGGACYSFCTWDTLEQWRQGLSAHGWRVRSCIVWDKMIHGLADLETCWGPRHEMILFAAKGRHELQGKRPVDVLCYPRVPAADLRHPYQKPEPLMCELMRTNSGTVLDPFMGSGTTLVAAKKLGRRAIGIEISQEYCDIAVERLRQKVLAYA